MRERSPTKINLPVFTGEKRIRQSATRTGIVGAVESPPPWSTECCISVLACTFGLLDRCAFHSRFRVGETLAAVTLRLFRHCSAVLKAPLIRQVNRRERDNAKRRDNKRRREEEKSYILSMLVAIHTRTLRHWRLAYGTTDVPFGPTRTVYPFETCMAVAATSVHCNMTLLKLDVTVWTDRQTDRRATRGRTGFLSALV